MKILQKSYNTLRVLSAEMIANSQVGDVRSCMMCAPVMFTLFKDFYNYFGGKEHINRDRFVLADVGMTPLYYATLNLFGINLSIDDLRDFGEQGSKTPVSPSLETDGVDAGVSAKGQGIPTAVGLALAGQSLASKFNVQKFNVISHYTYCLASTSNLQEGVSQEAMALAGNLKLSKLIVICNYIEQQAGDENLKKKYSAMGWNVIYVSRSSNAMFLGLALTRARLSQKPTLILLKNTLKKNFPEIKNRLITKNEVEKMKADFGFNGAYKVENNIRQYAARTSRRLKVEYYKWEKRVVLYRNTHPQLSEELNNYFVKPKLTISKSLKSKLESEKNLNEANKMIVDAIKDTQKCIMLASIKEKLLPIKIQEEQKIFSKKNYRAQNLVFGNRENAMAEICAGVSLYFGAPTYVYAPICLLGQMLSGVEHSAQNNIPVMFCFYQSGNCVNQQKTNIELYGQFEWLGNLKNIDIYQPATSMELLACYKNIYEKGAPSCMVLPQREYELLDVDVDLAGKGAYVFEGKDNANYTIVASGREFYIAKEVANLLKKSGKTVKLISSPSWTVFRAQPQKYRNSVLESTDENVVFLTRTNTKNLYDGKTNRFRYINVNDFTDTPEIITPELIKAIRKAIN